MATELDFMAPINTNTSTDDIFDEKFRRFRTKRTKSTPKTVSSSGKYRPSPPPHAHNLATPVDEEENNTFLKKTKTKKKKRKKKSSSQKTKQPPSLITATENTETSNNKLPLSPMQKWNLMQKMNDIVPLIQSFNTSKSPNISSKVQKSPQTTIVRHSDEYSDDDGSSDIDDHPSDDDVLSVNIHQQQRQHKNSMTENERTQSPTLSALNRLSALKNKHEYNRSMSAIFAPNDYDGVINALDVLQSFCRQVPAQNSDSDDDDAESDDGAHDSDDDVLRNDFDDGIMNEHDPFDTATEDSENMNVHNTQTQTHESEYDELPFYNIGNSTIQSQTTRTKGSSSTTEKSTHSSLLMTPLDVDTKLVVETERTKHARNETPIPLKTKYKSPKQQFHAHSVQLNTMNMNIYNRENRGNTLTPQSQTTSYLTTPIGINQRAISPSHSFSKTEISMDNADDYEYRSMNDGGGVKRKSHSHSIPGIISKETMKNENKENVDVILEEEEDENQSEIGILLKKPSIPGPTTPQNTIRSKDKFQRIRALGVPQPQNMNLYYQSPSSLVLSLSPKSAQNQSMMSIDSMVAERSAFNEEIESAEYENMVTKKKEQRSKSLHKLRESKIKRSRYYTHDVQIKRNGQIDEHDAENMGFISRKRKNSSKSDSKSNDGGKKTKKESAESPRQYTQYKVRKNKEQQININNEYNINNGHLVMERKQSANANNVRWSKMIVLVALFVCFMLGVLVGVGVSWLLFV